MSVLSGFLPVEQGVACWAALRAHTDTVKNTGDTRTRDQIMADTLVERLTGQARAGDVQAEIAIVIPVDALTDPTSQPGPALGPDRTASPTRPCGTGSAPVAEVLGYGPLPVPRSPARSSPTPGAGAGGGGCSPPPTAASSAATPPAAASTAPSPP